MIEKKGGFLIISVLQANTFIVLIIFSSFFNDNFVYYLKTFILCIFKCFAFNNKFYHKNAFCVYNLFYLLQKLFFCEIFSSPYNSDHHCIILNTIVYGSVNHDSYSNMTFKNSCPFSLGTKCRFIK